MSPTDDNECLFLTPTIVRVTPKEKLDSVSIRQLCSMLCVNLKINYDCSTEEIEQMYKDGRITDEEAKVIFRKKNKMTRAIAPEMVEEHNHNITIKEIV